MTERYPSAISEPTSLIKLWPQVYSAIRIILGLTLLMAAPLKVSRDARTPTAVRVGLVDSRIVVLATAVVEILLGSALIGGLWPKATRLVTIATFSVFTCVAGYEYHHHATSCGCFGSVQVPPVYTLTFDCVVVLLLLCTIWFMPVGIHREGDAGIKKPLWAGIITLLFIGLGVAASAVFEVRGRLRTPSGNTVLTSQEMGTPGSLVVLEPEQWGGHAFGLAAHINVGAQLMKGRWIVLLVHHDCDHCAAAVPRYISAFSSGGNSRNVRLAVIELPPYGGTGVIAPWVPLPSSVLAGRVDSSRDWFATTPATALIEDGTVVVASDGPSAEFPNPIW